MLTPSKEERISLGVEENVVAWQAAHDASHHRPRVGDRYRVAEALQLLLKERRETIAKAPLKTERERQEIRENIE